MRVGDLPVGKYEAAFFVFFTRFLEYGSFKTGSPSLIWATANQGGKGKFFPNFFGKENS